MSHETSRVVGVAIDNTAGTLVDISGDVNSMNWDGGMQLLDDTGLGDTRQSRVGGLSMPSQIVLNGWHKALTRAIFAPLVDGTSITKTVELKLAGGEYWTGECWPEQVTGFSAQPNAVNTWSCTLSAENGLTQTSVTAVA